MPKRQKNTGRPIAYNELQAAKSKMVDAIYATSANLNRADLGQFLDWLISEVRSHLDAYHEENQADEEAQRPPKTP